MPEFDLTTRIGRVQAAWWLRDKGPGDKIMSADERRAFLAALLAAKRLDEIERLIGGEDDCNIDALRSLIERHREVK